MYQIRFKSRRIKSDFNRFIDKLSEQKQKQILSRLLKNPFSTPSPYGDIGHIEKKSGLWCFEITGGDRVLFVIWKREKIVFIVFTGNHDKEIEFFRKYARKTK